MHEDEQTATHHRSDPLIGGGVGDGRIPATGGKSIVVNGRTHEVTSDTIGRDELARLAFPSIVADGRGALTVAYDHGPSEAPHGLVAPGRATRILHGQSFSVSLTDKS